MVDLGREHTSGACPETHPDVRAIPWIKHEIGIGKGLLGSYQNELIDPGEAAQFPLVEKIQGVISFDLGGHARGIASAVEQGNLSDAPFPILQGGEELPYIPAGGADDPHTGDDDAPFFIPHRPSSGQSGLERPPAVS